MKRLFFGVARDEAEVTLATCIRNRSVEEMASEIHMTVSGAHKRLGKILARECQEPARTVRLASRRG